MKIVQVNAVYGQKSTGIIVKDINDMLIKSGHNSYIIHAGKNKNDNNEIVSHDFLGEKIHALLSRLNGKQGLYSVTETKKIIKKLDEIKPDIIHLHNIHSNFINYKLLLEYTGKNKIPLVFTLHDCWMFTGKCYHFFDISCDKWKTGCGNCPKRNMDIPSILKDNSSYIFSLRKKLYSKNHITVVGCSKWITECAKKSPLFSDADFCQIYNGVDTEIFNMNAGNIREELKLKNKFVILTMANKWFDEKNETAREKIIGSLSENDRIIIAGCNEEQKEIYRDNEKIISVGYISDRKYLAKIYSTADVFLNLTFIDTLPTVNMESECCGTPVVTYDSGGSGELVENGKTGFTVKQNDIDGLILSIEKIRKREINSSYCGEYGKSNFDKEKNYLLYSDLYQNIFQKKKD